MVGVILSLSVGSSCGMIELFLGGDEELINGVVCIGISGVVKD